MEVILSCGRKRPACYPLQANKPTVPSKGAHKVAAQITAGEVKVHVANTSRPLVHVNPSYRALCPLSDWRARIDQVRWWGTP